MLIRKLHLVVLFFTLSTTAARHSSREYYSDGSSESEEESRSCRNGRCPVYPKQRRHEYHAIKYEEDDNIENRREDESPENRRKENIIGDNTRNKDNQQSNAFDIVKLLSLFANANKGKTKLSFNIRDIQSGFSNSGSKYHVGNVHREVNRQKRDTESEFNEVATLNNGGIETGLSETTDTSTDIAKTVNSFNSKELAVQSSAENVQTRNYNKSVDANVSNTEADNFQDFNATNIHDFAANDSTSVPVNHNEAVNEDFNNEQLVNEESNTDNNNNSGNETILQADDISNHSLESFNQTENNNPRNEEIFYSETNGQSNTNQSQPPKVKIPLSRNDLSNIQSTLNDEFGVPSSGANPVANFSLSPLDGKKKQVIVIVYNCSCGKNNPHSHEKSIEDVVLNNNNNNDDNYTRYTDEDLPTEILNTRRMIPGAPITSAQIEEEPTEENVENTTNSNAKPNYAQLENNMLKECTSLLALETKNSVNKETDINFENITTSSLSNEDSGTKISPAGENVEENSFYSENQFNNSSNNSDTFNNITQNNDDYNNGSITRVDSGNDTVNIENGNYDNAEVNPDTKTDANQASPVGESLDTVNNQENDPNLPTSDVIDDHNQRRRRSLLQDNFKNKFSTENVNHVQLSEELLKLLKLGYMSPNNFIGNYLQKHNMDVKERKRRSIKRKLLNYFMKKNLRSKREANVIDFFNNVVSSNFDRDYRPTKISNPKYYEHINDKPNLLESDTNSEDNDGTVIYFKPYEETKTLEEDYEENKNENSLGSFLDKVKNLSSETLHVNLYLQLMLKK